MKYNRFFQVTGVEPFTGLSQKYRVSFKSIRFVELQKNTQKNLDFI